MTVRALYRDGSMRLVSSDALPGCYEWILQGTDDSGVETWVANIPKRERGMARRVEVECQADWWEQPTLLRE